MAIVNFYAAAKAAAGTTTLKLPAGTMGALIEELAARNSDLSKLLPTCSFLLNGQSCEDKEQILIEGDAIDVLPQFAGG
jgi:molybdopterin converting factor small subunit